VFQLMPRGCLSLARVVVCLGVYTRRSLLLLVLALGLSVVLPTESSAQTTDWTICAYEGGVCAFTGTQQVRYGANGLYAYRTVTGGTPCSNSVFGDPAPGLTKQCDTSTTSTSTGSWSLCAYEGATCAFTGTQQVRYGANGLYAYRTLTGGTSCSNSVFGDPAPGLQKQCDTSTASTSSGSWSICAYEGGTCAFTGTQQVRFGANGLYAYRTLSGGASCSNSVFGDPAPGLPKQCDTSTASTSTDSWSICAYEGGVCAFTGTQQVRFGANGLYAYRTLSGGTSCSNSIFGDPAPGMFKQCETVGGSSIPPATSLPGTAVFTPSSNHATAVDSYVLDVFPVGADPNVAYSVGTHYLGKPPISNGEIRVDISSTIQTLAPGTYIATVTAVGIGGSARSGPSPPFTR